jgi:hypothetical protein
MINRCEVLQYIVKNYYGTAEKACEISGYSKAQMSNWLSGERAPQKATIEYLIQCAVMPEFKVIAEYAQFDGNDALQTQFKSILKGHINSPGLYAFYDALGGLLYVGKATRLMPEMIAAIKRSVHIEFPKGVKVRPSSRIEVVRYVSAYDVGTAKWDDFPKHVESLLLRISKPRLNKNIGYLARAHVQPKVD